MLADRDLHPASTDPSASSLRLALLLSGAVLLALAAVLLALDWGICLPAGKTARYLGRQESARCRQEEVGPWTGSAHDRVIAAELESILADIHCWVGLRLAEDKKNLAEAAEVVRLAPDNVGMHYNYGAALQQWGMVDQPEQSYQAAYKLAPRVSGRLVALTSLYTQQTSRGRTVRRAEEPVRRPPGDLQMRAWLECVKREAEGKDGR